MVNHIFHAISERNEGRFCWGIYVSNETHGKILKIIAILNIDVHEENNPVIEGSSMRFLNFFNILSKKSCSHEDYIFKVSVHWERWFLKIYFIFCLCYPISLNNIFNDVICLVNTDSIFILTNVNVEEFYFCLFSEGIFK